jgi:tRNA(fMet)-specific endonuclease VapC
MYLLDTNTIIYALKGSFTSIAPHFRAHSPSEIAIPAIVHAELLFGIEKSHPDHRERNRIALSAFLKPFKVIPFDAAASVAYAKIRLQLESVGQTIGPNDLLIGAIAKANNAILVTHNTQEFSRIAGLELADWCNE